MRLRGSCPEGVCDGSGWILDDEDVARPCACRERRTARAEHRRVRAEIPARFRGLGFDRNPIRSLDPMVIREVRSFIRDIDANLDAGRGRWFYGDVGTGKTSLAMLISQAALEAGRSVAIYSVPTLLAEISQTYEAASNTSYMELYRSVCDVDLLQLDDLESKRAAEWVLEQLYALVNERYEAKKSILVTTNLDQAELEEQIGARTVSRLVEMCPDQLLIEGVDRRFMPDDELSRLRG